MTKAQPSTSTINWGYNVRVAALFAAITILTSIYHSFRGIPIRWSDPSLVFAIVFGLHAFCDVGRSWRFKPPYIMITGFIIAGLIRRACESVGMLRQSGDFLSAVGNFTSDVWLALLIVSLFFAYRYWMATMLRLQSAPQTASQKQNA